MMFKPPRSDKRDTYKDTTRNRDIAKTVATKKIMLKRMFPALLHTISAQDNNDSKEQIIRRSKAIEKTWGILHKLTPTS